MPLPNYLTLSHLRKFLASITPRFQKIEKDIDNIETNYSTKEYVDEATASISVEPSDWNQNDETSNAYILNKPAIKAGDGENSVLIGQIEQDEDAAVYTLYITGALNGTTFSYTTQDTIPSKTSLLSYGVAYCRASGTLAAYQYQKIKDIDMTNNVISFYHSFSPNATTATNGELTIYYKYKTANGEHSCSEGEWTNSTNSRGHAEGSYTLAAGLSAHAEGRNTMAFGVYSHAEGNTSIATGATSHAEGFNTVALSSYQHVQGKYNIEDTANTYADIVGNGSSSARSNAYTLDWNGNGWYAGKVTVGTAPTADMDVATKAYVDDIVAAAAPTPLTVTISDDNVASVMLSDISPADINTAYSDGNVIVGNVDSISGISVGDYHLIFSSQTEAKFSDGANIITVSSTQVPSSQPAEIAGKYQCTVEALTISPNLSGLADTNISNPADGQVLQYDATSSKWVNGTAASLMVVSITNVSNGVGYCDKKASEIINHVQNGGNVLCLYDNQYCHLVDINSEDNSVSFENINGVYQPTINTYGLFRYDIYVSERNSASITSIDYTIPTVPTNVSAFTNDAGYQTATQVNELIAVALAQYGDGDTATYGYNDASEVNY